MDWYSGIQLDIQNFYDKRIDSKRIEKIEEMVTKVAALW